MKNNKTLIKLAAVCGLTLTIQSAFCQGSLTPPGSPAPTMKTLQQIEPRTDVSTLSGDAQSVVAITKPGSYYLTTNIIAVAGKHGILIASDNVTLNLNGFSLLGVPSSLSGVAVTNEQRGIAVLNGTVKGWGGAGVDFGLAVNLVRNAQLKDLRASGNMGFGIYCFGPATIINCIAEGNFGGGIHGGSSVIKDCVAMWNSGVGIEGDSYSTISGCVAEMQNSGAAISAGWGSTVRDCIAGSQGTEAMLVSSSCQILNNNCFGYGPGGATPAIRVTGSRNRIEGNRVSSAQSGILVDGTSNLIIRNSATGNGTDYSIAAGNCTGSIVAGEAALNAASNPNVNISF